MTISFSGLASGLDTDSWVEALVSVKQQEVTALETKLSAYETTKSTLSETKSIVSALRTALETLTDAKFGGSFDLFSQNSVTSSNEDVVTASVTSGATRQSYDIYVEQLATCTSASSAGAVSSIADDDTVLSDLGVTEGTLTLYVNGEKCVINIDDSDTLGDLKSRLAEYEISAEISEDGVLTFSAMNEEDTLNIGATTDTSNIMSLYGITQQEDGSYASANSLYKASTSSVLTSEDAGFTTQITTGTFTIGDATFTIDENTTLSSLISEINSSDEAQAYAYWDDTTGKLVITSKVEGASYINIEAGTSNFTDVMGLTTSEWDEDGNLTSTKMYTENQTLGQNAIFTINGTTMTSMSNTVTSDISRLDGVTLTLNRASTEDDGTTTLNVTQDTSGLLDAVNEFITAYNECIAQLTDVTASGADLHGESSLTSLSRTLKSYATSSNATNGGIYTLLSQIGISTASADSSNLSTSTYELSLDEDAFLAALAENPDSVESILVGDNGILNKMESVVEDSLSAVTGYFDIKSSTLDSQITKMEEKIEKKNENISTYQTRLENKFYQMELMISQMQSNYSAFLS